MKRIVLGAAAVAALAAAPAFAGGTHLSIGVFTPAPVVYQPAPVYYAPPPRPMLAYAPAPVYYAAPRGHWHDHGRRDRDRDRDYGRWGQKQYQMSYWDGPYSRW